MTAGGRYADLFTVPDWTVHRPLGRCHLDTAPIGTAK